MYTADKSRAPGALLCLKTLALGLGRAPCPEPPPPLWLLPTALLLHQAWQTASR